MVKQSKFKLLVYVFQKMKSTCTFLCKCMFYLIFMLKSKLSIDKKTLKKTKKNEKTWDGLTMQKNYKKQQNKTNKQKKAGYVFLIFLQ